MKSTEETIKVWDPIVRIGHWTLVLAFFIAYFTEDDFLTLHVWAGYALSAVVAFRLLWGVIGSQHAHFTDFVYSPATIWRYARDLRHGHGKRYLGHNPLGGAMIMALLLSLTVTAYTGLGLYAIENHAGPLAHWFAANSVISLPLQSDSKAHVASKDRHKEDAREEFWEELHEFFANFTLLLVALHIAGGLLSSRIYQENLIRSMITGKKRRSLV